ncbi:MAG: sugar transferase [Candidatus Niyogibacteria bacterium]|nr:MAG: sugar transferase [Candidatus Niyogibacteria bacterium]
MNIYRLKSFVLIIGDLAVFYMSLALTIALRYGSGGLEKWWLTHLAPFSALFVLWIVIFVIAGLYDPLSFSASRFVRERVIRTMLFAGAVSIAIFYIYPQPTITPKTNLAMDLVLSAIFLIIWRGFYGKILARSDKTKVIFFGWSNETEEIINLLYGNPQLGYEPIAVIMPSESEKPKTILPTFVFNQNLTKLIYEKRARLIVASLDIHNNYDFIKMIYEVLPLGVAYLNFPQFYERITGKIPVSMISEMWFLENMTENEKRVFEILKRTFDVFAGVMLGIIALLILPFAATAIKLGDPGPVFFRQKRVGRNGKIFELIKFRSKIHDEAWKNSGWHKEEDKKRTTLIGKIIRKSYIDELPQALNIIKGEMSLIGPRPERPEFVENLKIQIPHYMMRLLVRPGISGWAQIKMKYDASAADALEKLQYDLYYIKNRSFGLDVSIALKTLFAMISRSGK